MACGRVKPRANWHVSKIYFREFILQKGERTTATALCRIACDACSRPSRVLLLCNRDVVSRLHAKRTMSRMDLPPVSDDENSSDDKADDVLRQFYNRHTCFA